MSGLRVCTCVYGHVYSVHAVFSCYGYCPFTQLGQHWRSGHLELMVEVYVGEPGPHPGEGGEGGEGRRVSIPVLLDEGRGKGH